MSGTTDDAAAVLGRFAAEVSPPPAVRDAAGLVLADTLGAILIGAGTPEVRRFAAARAGQGAVRVPGGFRADAPMAALLIGFAGTAAELDEGNYAAGGHPAIHAVAAALAEADRDGVSGRALLDAVVVGYEAGGWIGAATRLRPAAHPHGTWGTVGAAAAVARLRGWDAARTAAAVRVASSLGLATSATAAPRGGSVRNLYAGLAARNGLLACDFAEAGVTGEPGGVEAVFSGVIGEGFDGAALRDGLGRHWLVAEPFLKLGACCRETQGALAVLERLLADTPFAADDVEAIEVATFAPASLLREREPEQPIAGRFSIPFALATRLVGGEAFADAFSPASMADPARRALARRVTVREEPAMTARLPLARPCRLAVRLRDGRMLAAEADSAPGDPSDPLPEDALRRKFERMAEALPPERRAACWRAFRFPDDAGGVREMLSLTEA